MDISITKGRTEDSIEARRADGSVVTTTFPHKGPIPHDAVHYFVESGVGLRDGFWGLVASGRHPEEVQDIAKAAGHASASRARAPEDFFVPVIQAERIVECFEADLWGGGSDPESIRSMISAGCAQSLVPDYPISDSAIGDIRARITDFRERWTALALGESCTLEWEEGRRAQ